MRERAWFRRLNSKAYRSLSLPHPPFLFLLRQVNADGSLSRIHNWAAMTDAERATTLRVINKRNQTRLALLREAGANQESTVSITEDANAQQTANRGSSGVGAAAQE